jgi:hypothetical protein
MKELVEHIRTVHFTVLVIVLALTACSPALWLTYLTFGLGWNVGLSSNLMGERLPSASE